VATDACPVGEHELAVGPASEVPSAFVEEVMVTGTQQNEIVDIGEAAISPVVDVVGVAPGGGSVTVGERAPPVAQGEGSPLGGGHEAGFAAEVEQFAVGGEHGADHRTARRTASLRRRAPSSPSIALTKSSSDMAAVSTSVASGTSTDEGG
jgi:hypothetical protein